MATIDVMMRTPIVSVSAGDTIDVVARRMRDAAVGAVVVVEDDRVTGMFTERDLLVRVVAAGLPPDATRVDAVATRVVVTVERSTRVQLCAKLLRDRNIRHLPVVDDGRPVGMVSARDFFAHIAVGLEAFIDQARYERALSDDRDPYAQLGGAYRE